MYKRILVAIDLSYQETSQKTLDAAAELAGTQGAELRLIYVRFMIERALEYLPNEAFDKEEEDARVSLMKLAQATGLPDDRLSAVSPIGGVYHQVLTAAAEYGADLIVTGPHSPSMSKYLLGMDASQIVRHAPISVLVVR